AFRGPQRDPDRGGARDRPLLLPGGAAPDGDLHPPRERPVAAGRREARIPLRGAAAPLHPHQRRLARPLLLRADRRGGSGGRARPLEIRPRARRRRSGPRRRPREGRAAAAPELDLADRGPRKAASTRRPSYASHTIGTVAAPIAATTKIAVPKPMSTHFTRRPRSTAAMPSKKSVIAMTAIHSASQSPRSLASSP